jgi:peptidoglycan/LPS O-acetylase OafA/YrhL
MEINERFSVYMHQVRWIAALAVVIGHIRTLMFVNYNAVEHKTILVRAFYFLTGFGHQAVMVFFVLSGFLVGGKVVSRIKQDSFNSVNYLINRISRLYIVLIFALMTGYALDTIGSNYFNQTGVYSGSHEFDFGSMREAPPKDRLGADILLSNLFMCQTILTPTLGSNGPLWSLANEFWYYLLFPPLFLLLFGKGTKRTKFILLMVSFLLAIFLPVHILDYFLVWLIGVGITLAKKVSPKFTVPAIGVFLAILAALRFVLISNFWSDLLIGVAFGITMISFMGNSAPVARLKIKKFHEKMSGFSYSLYALHFPMILLTLAVMNKVFKVGFGHQPSLKIFPLYISVLLAVYCYSYLVSRVTEENTPIIRKWLRQIVRVIAEKRLKTRGLISG